MKKYDLKLGDKIKVGDSCTFGNLKGKIGEVVGFSKFKEGEPAIYFDTGGTGTFCSGGFEEGYPLESYAQDYLTWGGNLNDEYELCKSYSLEEVLNAKNKLDWL